MPLRPLDVPAIPRKPWALLCLVLNLVPGGVGTIVAGVKSGHRWSILWGVLQLVLVVALVGWIWSAVWGLSIYLRSRGH